MKNLFHFDGPLFQALNQITDMVILNVLCTLCCLPVVTAGASIAAAHKIAQGRLFKSETPIARSFFRAFKENFKQASIVWLVTMVIVAVAMLDMHLVTNFFEGASANIMFGLLVVVIIIVASVLSYLYPLIVRYQNTLRNHLYNAFMLALARLPLTILMLILNAIPLVLLFFLPEWFLKTVVFWIAIGFSCIILFNNILLRPVFQKLEAHDGDSAQQ